MDDLERHAAKRVGTVLCKKWRLDRLLGVGGFAAVYSATHRAGKRVAVKILHPLLSAMPEVRERFLREAYAVNHVDHPGVTSVLDDDVSADGTMFLVMDLLVGETLEERRERSGGRLPVEEVLTVCEQVLDVLTAVHDKGVIHRDLKPDNIFLTDDGQVRVLDFGIARICELSAVAKVTQTGMTLGTPAFMPPEQAAAEWSKLDHRSDLWALGATMFTLLSGEHVHGDESPVRLIVAAVTKSAPPLKRLCPQLPDAVCALVDRALAFARKDRFPSAQEMRRELRQAYRAMTDSAASTNPIGVTGTEATKEPATMAPWEAITAVHAKPDQTWLSAQPAAEAATADIGTASASSLAALSAPSVHERARRLRRLGLISAAAAFLLVVSLASVVLLHATTADDHERSSSATDERSATTDTAMDTAPAHSVTEAPKTLGPSRPTPPTASATGATSAMDFVPEPSATEPPKARASSKPAPRYSPQDSRWDPNSPWMKRK